MMISIILHGCGGVMGQVVSRMAKESRDIEIAAGVDIKEALSKDYPVVKDIRQAKKGDVILDFSTAAAADSLLDYVEETRIPAVICTTGLSRAQLERLERLSKDGAILRSANMSLGINLLARLVQEAAKTLFGAGFDMEILEAHHKRKVDAPSGTALLLADRVNEAFDHRFSYVFDRSGRREKRMEKEIGISSIRGGSIVGDHTVIFAGEDEVITLSHRAYSRQVFGAGALAAVRFLAGKAPGYYTMEDVIGSLGKG